MKKYISSFFLFPEIIVLKNTLFVLNLYLIRQEFFMKDWISINGRTFLAEEFIGILDNYRSRRIIIDRGAIEIQKYCRMIFVLQELTSDYMQGIDFVADELSNFITRNMLKMPNNRMLPNALEELFNQMQENIHIDLSELLDECVEKSKITYERIQEKEKKEKERIDFIQSLQIEDTDITNKVRYLMNLQNAKIKILEYEVTKNETLVTNIWCEILILSLSSDVITYNIMKRVVDNQFIAEEDITDLLKEKYNIEKDYEWYLEDFLGQDFDEFTDIKINDFLDLCEDKFLKILGIDSI